ncbi:unnamed protein product, partial [Timema podura]|nr:unnamed protein product [Timema podura]
PRTVDWFLVRSSIPVLITNAVFIKSGNVSTPLHKPMFQVLQAGWWGSYNLFCQPVDYSSRPQALRLFSTVVSKVHRFVENIDYRSFLATFPIIASVISSISLVDFKESTIVSCTTR